MFTKWLTENSSTPKRNARPVLAVALSAALLVTSGCSLLPKEDEEEVLPTINAPKISEKPRYDVVTETLITSVGGMGRLMSLQEETLFFKGDSKVDGKKLKELYVKSGDVVKKGQPIAELDVSDLQKQLRSKQLEFRKDEAEMKKTLRDSDTMDPVDLEQAKIAFEEKRQVLQDLQNDIGSAVLTAPFDGTIVTVSVQKGATIKAYDPIALLADTSRLAVAAQLTNKEDYNKIALGMSVEVEINGAGKQTGKIKRLPVLTDDNNNQNGGFNGGFNGGYNDPNGNGQKQDSIDNYLLVDIDKMPKEVSRGTPLSIKVITNRKENAVVIPLVALRQIGSRTYVQVVDEQGKREVDVEIGQQTSTSVEILKGLTPGQKVVGK